MRRLFFILIFLSTISLGFAHDLWLEKKDNFYILFYGHIIPHKNQTQNIKILRYNPENVKSIICVDNLGKKKNIPLNFTYPIKFKAVNCSLIYVIYSSGYWSKTPYGEFNKPKNKVNMVIDSWESYEIVKKINSWNKHLEKNFIDSLDIIPLKNPLKLKIGDKIKILLLYKGKPVKNIPVYYNGKFRGITDEEGKINIRIKHPGFQMIKASYKRKIFSKEADNIIYTTNLIFEIKK